MNCDCMKQMIFLMASSLASVVTSLFSMCALIHLLPPSHPFQASPQLKFCISHWAGSNSGKKKHQITVFICLFL